MKDEAIKSYFTVEIDPEYDRFLYSNIYDEIGKKDKAIYYYKKVIDIIPKII